MEYNQTLRQDTKYACAVYTCLNIFKQDYGIIIEDGMIIKFIYYLEKIGVLILSEGAVFSIIYGTIAKYVSIRYGVKIGVKTSTISGGLDDKSTWGIGLKKLSSVFINLSNDGLVTKEDVDEALKVKGYGHNHAIKQSSLRDVFIITDSWNGVKYDIFLKTLQYALSKGLYYDTARTFIPLDFRTKAIQNQLLYKAQKRKRYLTEAELITTIKDSAN